MRVCYEVLADQMDAKQLKRWRALDLDGNGAIEIEEILQLEKEIRSLGKMVFQLSIVAVLLLLGVFGVSIAAAIMAQSTQVQAVSGGGPALLGTGASADKLVQTASAEQQIALAHTPLLALDDFAKIREVSISKLQGATTADAAVCTSCPQTIVFQVDVGEKYSDVKVVFRRTQGIEVTVERGRITVTNVPGQPGKTFVACGALTCSAVSIAGVDTTALKRKAIALGFVGGRRVAFMREHMRKQRILRLKKQRTRRGGSAADKAAQIAASKEARGAKSGEAVAERNDKKAADAKTAEQQEAAKFDKKAVSSQAWKDQRVTDQKKAGEKRAAACN